MRILKLSVVLFTLGLALLPAAEARPFRAMVTRTASTTGPQNLELGLRYQGFYVGDDLNALGYTQLSPGVRFGILERLELNLYFDFMVLQARGSPAFNTYIGDVPVGLQFTLVSTPLFALGVWGRLTVPVGAANFERLPLSLQDRIPPSLSDGTWDAEGTLIAELRLSPNFRVMANVGYMYQGVRGRNGGASFDVPDAIRYDLAATMNFGEDVLVGVELVGRSYLNPRITPAWTNNANQLELLPSARFEVVPNFVLEAAVGAGLTRDLGEIYRIRALLGFTYEFDLAGRGTGRQRAAAR